MHSSQDLEALIAFLPVRDLDRTEAFYAGGLGLRLALDQGRCRIFEVTAGGLVGFCRSDEVPERGRIILTLVTPDPDGHHAALAAAGLDVQPLEENEEFRIRRFFIEDPDGYLVEFQRFWDPGWRQGGGGQRRSTP